MKKLLFVFISLLILNCHSKSWPSKFDFIFELDIVKISDEVTIVSKQKKSVWPFNCINFELKTSENTRIYVDKKTDSEDILSLLVFYRNNQFDLPNTEDLQVRTLDYINVLWPHLNTSELELVHLDRIPRSNLNIRKIVFAKKISNFLSTDFIQFTYDKYGRIVNIDFSVYSATCSSQYKIKRNEAIDIAKKYLIENKHCFKKESEFTKYAVSNSWIQIDDRYGFSNILKYINLKEPISIHPNYFFSSSIKKSVMSALKGIQVLDKGNHDEAVLSWVLNFRVEHECRKLRDSNIKLNIAKYISVWIDANSGKIIGGDDFGMFVPVNVVDEMLRESGRIDMIDSSNKKIEFSH